VPGPKNIFTLAMAQRRAAFSDNTSLTATFSRSFCERMSEIYTVYPRPTNRGPQNSVFRRLCNVTGLTAYIFGKTHDIHNWASVLTTTGGFKTLLTLVHKRLKIGPAFYPCYVNFASYTSLPCFADGHQQTEINQTLPNGYQ